MSAATTPSGSAPRARLRRLWPGAARRAEARALRAAAEALLTAPDIAAARAALGGIATTLGHDPAPPGGAVAERLATAEDDGWRRAILAHAAGPAWVIDAAGAVRVASQAAAEVLGHDVPPPVGTPLRSLAHPGDADLLTAALAAARAHPGATGAPLVCRWRHADGGQRWLETRWTDLLADPAVGGIVVAARDVSERVALQDRLAEHAFHDGLTGLPNRALFADRLRHRLSQSHAHEDRLAVLFLDLDLFGKVNDSFGHAAGDALLRACGRRLVSRLGPGDTVARLSGDEFAVLLESCPSPEAASQMARYLLDALAEPYELDERRVTLSASAGIVVVAAGDEPTLEDVLRNADIALSRAKEDGAGAHRIYEDRMHAAALRRTEIEAELRRAIAMGQFVLHYQPIVDAASGAISGAEALVRWNHPTRGLLGPGEFIPVAEQAGLIDLLGSWILREAIRQAAVWRAAGVGGGNLWMSVNLSVEQLANPAIAAEVELALRAHDLPAALLVLELTESAVMRDVVMATQRLDQLKRLGVRIAVDDFGEGHSSLAYLASLPLDVLKIPRAFVEPLRVEGANLGLVRAIIELARSFDLVCVAEGIEDEAQLAPLRRLGCDLGQGYLFGRPAPPEALVARTGVATTRTPALSRRRGAAAPRAATRAS